METTVIIPKKDDTRWVAVDVKNPDTILAEGTTPEEVIEKAEKTGIEYSLMYVPDPNSTYIF